MIAPINLEAFSRYLPKPIRNKAVPATPQTEENDGCLFTKAEIVEPSHKKSNINENTDAEEDILLRFNESSFNDLAFPVIVEPKTTPKNNPIKIKTNVIILQGGRSPI